MERVQSDISFDDFVVAVSDIQRRELLIALHNAGPDEAIDPFAPGADTYSTSLYHVHLPVLATQGFISWDRDDGTVRRGPDFDAIAPFLTVLVEYQTVLPKDFLHDDPEYPPMRDTL